MISLRKIKRAVEAVQPPDDDLRCTYEGNEIDGWNFYLYDGDELIKEVTDDSSLFGDNDEQFARRRCGYLLKRERQRRQTQTSGEIRV